MSGEDQERFEDYLELEHYIEELQAGRVAHPPAELTPSQANIYRMAAFFRSAAPEAGEPRPEFAAELQARLEQELHEPPKRIRFPFLHKKQDHGNQGQAKKLGNVSRRALLTSGAAVAASLVAGAAIEHVIEQPKPSSTVKGDQANYTTTIIGEGVPTTWQFVTTLAELGDQAIRFTSGAVIGYIIRNDGDDAEEKKAGPVIAVSAACTHMGCIVQWQDSDRKFHCPCHGGRFTEYGKPDKGVAPVLYLRALPKLKAKVEKNGDIYVEVPLTHS